MPELAGISETRWTYLLDLIEMRKVVPIVGRRMSLVDAGNGQSLPFKTAVTERLAKELGVEPLPPGWGLSKLYLAAAERKSFHPDAFHYRLRHVLGAMKPHLEPLRKIAEVTDFKMFLSIAIDGFLDQAVREVRSAIGDIVTTYTFAPGYGNPQRPLDQPGGVCVYNLLGSLHTFPTWAVTVEELVDFVLRLHGEKDRPERLFDALKDCHLLAIGCQIPDWLGRFFLQALRDGPISTQRTATILVDDEQHTDSAFGEYLELFSGKSSFVVPGDAFAFTDQLNRRWKERAGSSPPAPPYATRDSAPRQASGKVFISYSHEDGQSADDLYEFLCGQRIEVWKDDRYGAIEPGANWPKEIERQIADCACFVPLISRNTASVSDAYFWKEWNLALKRREHMDVNTRLFIFPVLCEPGLAVPEQFHGIQWKVLSNQEDRKWLAATLHKEQQRLRKERR